MKNLVVNYDIINDTIDGTIILLSDLHDYPGKRKTSLAEEVKCLNPDAIVVAGDILMGNKYSKDNPSQKNLKRFLSELSEGCPVILGLGNHDLISLDEEGYKDLESARPGSVIALSNDGVVSSKYRIVEFHPRHSAFSPSTQESGNALLEFAEDFEKKGKKLPDDGLFNIMIAHNPKIIAQARSVQDQIMLGMNEKQLERLRKVSEEMKKYDLILSGHLHNGYRRVTTTTKDPKKYMDRGIWEMPQEKDIDGNTKLIRPWIFKKTDMCRGVIYVACTSERILILSDGSYHYQKGRELEYVEITEKQALEMINRRHMTPIVISGGVNKFFNLPIDKPEITRVKLLKR